MIKIISYKTKLDENNKWHFTAITPEQDLIDEILYVRENASANEVNEAAKNFMFSQGFELVKPEYMPDQKTDLSYVRTQMRKIIKRLSDDNAPLNDRKEYLDIATAITQSSNVITKAVSLELACDKFERIGK